MLLTDVAIRSAKPQAKTVRLFDGGGLYLEFSPAGGKWWRWKYRFDGKETRLSFGVYPDVSLKSARDRRDGARKLLASDVVQTNHAATDFGDALRQTPESSAFMSPLTRRPRRAWTGADGGRRAPAGRGDQSGAAG